METESETKEFFGGCERVGGKTSIGKFGELKCKLPNNDEIIKHEWGVVLICQPKSIQLGFNPDSRVRVVGAKHLRIEDDTKNSAITLRTDIHDYYELRNIGNVFDIM